MGLDIYKYRVDKNGDKKVYYDNKAENQYISKFIKRYKNQFENELNEYYNMPLWFKNNNLDIKNYYIIYTTENIKIVNSENQNEIIIVDRVDMPVVFELDCYLKCDELEYQRKDMKDEFYTDYLNKGNYIFYTNTVLNKVKTLSNIGSNIRAWYLNKDEFVLCDW